MMESAFEEVNEGIVKLESIWGACVKRYLQAETNLDKITFIQEWQNTYLNLRFKDLKESVQKCCFEEEFREKFEQYPADMEKYIEMLFERGKLGVVFNLLVNTPSSLRLLFQELEKK